MKSPFQLDQNQRVSLGKIIYMTSTSTENIYKKKHEKAEYYACDTASVTKLGLQLIYEHISSRAGVDAHLSLSLRHLSVYECFGEIESVRLPPSNVTAKTDRTDKDNTLEVTGSEANKLLLSPGHHTTQSS